jgi:DNA invertase Pin-like site-specific DNA recombinase
MSTTNNASCAMKTLAPARVVGYIRVSTAQQADGGVSLDTQAAKIRAMAVVQGASLLDIIVDAGESAKSLNRSGMTRLLNLVDARSIDTVIIAKLDRLTRSVADLADLLKRFERRGVSLISVADSLDTKSAAGRLVLNIMVSVSQWEREAIGERTRDALHHKRALGLRAGNLPYGYTLAADGATLIADTGEQEVLGAVRRLRGDGYSLRRVAARLNEEGRRTRAGTPWRHEYVANLLRLGPSVM